MTQLTTQQVANRLNRTRPRIIQLIHEGKIKAKKFGREWVIQEKDIKKIKLTKPTGRPKK